MLMKWKKEKELKKKMEMAEQAKKKPFRVVHIETEVFPFQKNFTHSFKVCLCLFLTFCNGKSCLVAYNVSMIHSIVLNIVILTAYRIISILG